MVNEGMNHGVNVGRVGCEYINFKKGLEFLHGESLVKRDRLEPDIFKMRYHSGYIYPRVERFLIDKTLLTVHGKD
jgi:hypothetical protein